MLDDFLKASGSAGRAGLARERPRALPEPWVTIDAVDGRTLPSDELGRLPSCVSDDGAGVVRGAGRGQMLRRVG